MSEFFWFQYVVTPFLPSDFINTAKSNGKIFKDAQQIQPKKNHHLLFFPIRDLEISLMCWLQLSICNKFKSFRRTHFQPEHINSIAILPEHVLPFQGNFFTCKSLCIIRQQLWKTFRVTIQHDFWPLDIGHHQWNSLQLPKYGLQPDCKNLVENWKSFTAN